MAEDHQTAENSNAKATVGLPGFSLNFWVQKTVVCPFRAHFLYPVLDLILTLMDTVLFFAELKHNKTKKCFS